VNREADELGEGTMAMENDSELFAKADQQVSALKERIARQREAIKRAKLTGHSTAAAEAAQQALEGTLRVFEKRRRQVFERLEAKQRS
jgi:C4-dicarboxylate-specific signal transduction histidine kinase